MYRIRAKKCMLISLFNCAWKYKFLHILKGNNSDENIQKRIILESGRECANDLLMSSNLRYE